MRIQMCGGGGGGGGGGGVDSKTNSTLVSRVVVPNNCYLWWMEYSV